MINSSTDTLTNRLTFFERFLSKNIQESLLSKAPDREVKASESYSLSSIKEIASKVLVELNSLHKKQLILGNLKLENVFPDKDDQIPCDFSKAFSAESIPTDFKPDIPYMSPEVAMRAQPYTSEIDMWSLGCILYRMFTGTLIFNAKDEMLLMKKHIEVLGSYPSEFIKNITSPEELAFFSKPMQVGNSEDVRQKLIDRKSNETYSNAQAYLADLVMQMLEYNPKDRITPELALHHPFICGEYKYRLNMLGEGGYSMVYENTTHDNLTKVALKVSKFSFERGLSQEEQSLIKEAKIIKRLNEATKAGNPHIIRLHANYRMPRIACLALELCTGGTLTEKLSKGSFSLDRIQNMGKQLLSALSFLKKQNLMHADLRNNNIMFRDSISDELVVLDFGLALNVGETLPKHTLTQRYFRSPEVYLKARPYTPAIDMWALGCLLYQMFTSDVLFPAGYRLLHLSHTKVLGKYPADFVAKAKYKTKIEYVKSAIIKQQTSLKKLITEHKSAKDCESKLISAFVDLLEKILVYEPEKRLTPDEALDHAFFKNESSKSLETIDREIK